MDKNLIKMKIQRILLIILLFSSKTMANAETEELRLLKSWGLKFNAQGLLRFNQSLRQQTVVKPWSPDLSAYHAILNGDKKQHQINPVVISAREKPE